MNPLKEYQNNVTSQYGEDGVISRIFEIIPKEGERWCVEFGAWDGKYMSNTYDLITNHGWHGVLIEGNAGKMPDLKATYGGNDKAHLINALVHFEGSSTLDNILKTTPIPEEFDLLSIDIDGNDYHIWNSLDKYRPGVIVIEFNPMIPSDIEHVQPKDFSINHGNSLLAYVNLGKEKGYELVTTTHCNAFFVRADLFPLFGIEDNSIEKLRDTEPPSVRVYPLFDGTLAIDQQFKIPWGNYLVEKYDLQKLPRHMRHFGDSTQKPNIFKRAFFKIYKKYFL